LLQRLCFLTGKPLWDEKLQIEERVDRFNDPFLPQSSLPPSEGFQTAANLVLFHDATYIVLCPGDEEQLQIIARAAGPTWKNTPFVADNRDLSITMKLLNSEYMRLDRGQAIPAIMEYDGTNHIIDFGRG